MTGAVVGLSVAMAASPSPTVVVRPEGMAGPGGSPPGAVRSVLPGGAVRALAPVQLRLAAPVQAQVPAGGPLQTRTRLRALPAPGGPLQAPARLRIQVPAGLPLQTPARLRLQARMPAGVVAPLPRIRVLPGKQVPVAALAPRAVRLRVRPGQVRVRLRVPPNAPILVLPGGPGRPLRVVSPGSRPLRVLPAGPVTPARLRIAVQKGQPVPARLVLPASLPGRARLRLQIPARARLTPALPAPPNW